MYFAPNSVLFLVFFGICVAVNAHHPNITPAHSRRSLAFKKKAIRPLDAPALKRDLGNGIGDILGGVGEIGSGVGGILGFPPASESPASSSGSSSFGGTTPSPSSTSVASDSSASSSKDCGLLGGLFDSDCQHPSTPPASSPQPSGTSSQDVSSTDAPSSPPATSHLPSFSASSSPTPSTSRDCGLLGLGCILPPPPASSTDAASSSSVASPPSTSPASPPPTSDPPAPSTSRDCGLLGLGCIIPPPPASSPSNTDVASSSPGPSPPLTSPVSPPPTSPASSDPSSSDCGLLGLGCIFSPPPASQTSNAGGASSLPVVTTPPAPSHSTPPLGSSSSSDCGILGLGCIFPTHSSSEGPSVTSPSTSGSVSASITSLPVSVTSSTGISGSVTSSTVVISFPTGSSTANSSSTLTSANQTATFTPPPPPSEFSFLTQTTLLFTSFPTPSSPNSETVTDPDAPATTLSGAGTSGTAAPVSAPLPNDIPARIYPPQPIPDGTDLSEYTLISILFDNSLPWAFVTGSGDSQAQLLSWLPNVLQGALPLTQDQIKTFALQVYIPESYTGPNDRDQLMTTWLGYILTDQVNTLANEIKVKNSQFYTGSPVPYSTLAGHVNPAYSLRSISNPNEIPGGGGTTTGKSDGSGSGGGSSNHSRQDAIIGVVSALGGITLIVLAVLIFRSVKRRRELAHRRLSDPNLPNDPYPDRAGRDFDQDSVGGQRRRSFYFAEDSLRGASGVSNQAQPGPGPSTMGVGDSTVEYSYRNSPDEMRERRPFIPNAISAPVLQQSSMNW